MKLFDDIDCSDTGVASETEPDFSFLNRSARPFAQDMRKLLEGWFTDYPDGDDKEKLRNEFRSERNPAHKGALFELYCYILLRRQDFDVDLHKVADKSKLTRPDFLVSRAGSQLFYMEVTVSADGLFDAGAQKRLGELYDGLNERLSSPSLLVGVEVDEVGPTSPPLRRIKAFLEGNLQTLDPKNFNEAEAQWTWSDSGWKIDFWGFPKTKDHLAETDVRPVGQIIQGGEIAPEKPLLKALKRKAGHYGEPDLPFVIAINATDDFTDYSDVEDALLGRKNAVMDSSTRAIRFQRPQKAQALWVNPAGQHSNRRVSGVFVAFHARSGTRMHSNEPPALYHNPWANKPLNPDLWQGLQKFIDPEGLAVTARSGKDPLDVLGVGTH